MLDSHTWWQIFRGAQALRLHAGTHHLHPHWYLDCVFCDCCNRLHAAALDLLARHDQGDPHGQ
jgi:hypothetical protein